MSHRRIYVLSDSNQIIDMVRSIDDDARVAGIGCLKEPGLSWQGATLVVDPGAVHPCCLDTLRSWSMQSPLRQVLYLTLPAPPPILFALPQIHPGRITDMRGIRAALERDRRGSVLRSAWRDLGGRLFTGSGDDRLRQFLTLVREGHQRDLTVASTAAALGVGLRHMSRLAWKWFGYPPRVVLGLFRVECLTQDLRTSGMRVTELARLHGFANRRSLSRHFQSYTGMTPAAYRFARQAGVSDGAQERVPAASAAPTVPAARPAAPVARSSAAPAFQVQARHAAGPADRGRWR